MEQQDEDALLVGVDGGATEAKAHVVVEGGGTLDANGASAGFCYERADGFQPVALAQQLDEQARDSVSCTPCERAQSELHVEAFARAIESVAARSGVARLRIGVCAPGLKTANARGIAVAKNGPRIPDFVDQLERRLVLSGLVLARPIPPLIGDGLACALGESASAQGGLRGVSNAYYIGGGTGIAECFVLNGRAVSLDDAADVSRKAWSMTSSLGRDYEAHLSARGLNARFVELGGSPDLAPELAVKAGHFAARQAFAECAEMLARLVNLRVAELRQGRGVVLERAVVGQRLGAFLADPNLRSVLREPAERACSIPIHASTLRAAPAIGAAHWALGHDSRGVLHAG